MSLLSPKYDVPVPTLENFYEFQITKKTEDCHVSQQDLDNLIVKLSSISFISNDPSDTGSLYETIKQWGTSLNIELRMSFYCTGFLSIVIGVFHKDDISRTQKKLFDISIFERT